MSLLDDVSIVVTPNGYKAGELYAVVPTYAEGSEIIQNVDFSSDTWWQKSSTNVNISNGKGNYTAGTTEYFYKLNILTVGKRYKLVYEITDYTTGYLSAFGGNWSGAQDAVGTYEIYFTCVDDDFGLVGNTFVGSIDNVSVKEYTSADMDVTRATAATRVDENGLVNYAEIIGGEEIVDGDFPSGTTAWTFGSGWSLGVDSAEATSGSSGKLSQTNTLNGKYAQVTLTVSNYGGAGLILIDFGSTGSAYITSDGTHTLYGTYDQDIFEIYKSSTFSGTVTNISVKEVTRDNVPRIDYTGGGCPHILAEPQRTNLFPYSEDFSQWQKNSNITLSLNSTTAPDGSVSADNISYVGSIGTPNDKTLQKQISVSTSNKDFTNSVYIKGTGEFRIKNTHGGVVDNYSSDFTATSNWVRYDFPVSNSSSAGNGSQIAGILASSTNSAFNLDVWGAQIEQGSYATSYIPTSGSTVTRNQDIFTRDGIGSLINSTEGVLFVEMAALANDGSYRVITISDGTSSDYIALYYTPTSNSISWELKVGNAVQFSRSVSLPLGSTSFNKFAFKYKENDCKLFLNGVESDIYTSNVTFTSNTLNSLFLTNGDGILLLFGKVKQLQVYDTALTDTQLAALTS